MKNETRFWTFTVLGILIVLFTVIWSAPGLGMPGQNMVRQTVPTRTPTPVLEPRIYLPFVLRNAYDATHLLER